MLPILLVNFLKSEELYQYKSMHRLPAQHNYSFTATQLHVSLHLGIHHQTVK